MTSRQRWALVFIVALGACARLAAVSALVGFAAPPSNDGISYDLLARNLLESGAYRFSATDYSAFRPPVFPLLLAAAYSVVGPSFAAARLVNVILGTATIVLVFRFSREAFGVRAGLLAALGIALHPLALYATGELYPETLCLFLLALLGVLLVPSARSPQALPRSTMAGVLLGLLSLTRPNLAPLLILVIAGFGVTAGWRRAVRSGAALFAGFLVVLLPWTIRNAVRFGEFIPLTTQAGVVFWQANHPESRGGLVWPDAVTWRDGPPPEREVRGWEGISESESSRRFMKNSLTWLRSAPVEALELVPRRLERLWSISATAVQNSGRRVEGESVIFQASYYVFALAALAGLVRTRRRWRELYLLYAVIVVVHLSAAVFSGSPRYALPMALSLVCFAAAFLAADRLRPGQSSLEKSAPSS